MMVKINGEKVSVVVETLIDDLLNNNFEVKRYEDENFIRLHFDNGATYDIHKKG